MHRRRIEAVPLHDNTNDRFADIARLMFLDEHPGRRIDIVIGAAARRRDDRDARRDRLGAHGAERLELAADHDDIRVRDRLRRLPPVELATETNDITDAEVHGGVLERAAGGPIADDLDVWAQAVLDEPAGRGEEEVDSLVWNEPADAHDAEPSIVAVRPDRGPEELDIDWIRNDVYRGARHEPFDRAFELRSDGDYGSRAPIGGDENESLHRGERSRVTLHQPRPLLREEERLPEQCRYDCGRQSRCQHVSMHNVGSYASAP